MFRLEMLSLYPNGPLGLVLDSFPNGKNEDDSQRTKERSDEADEA